MFEHYVLIDKKEHIEEKFNARFTAPYRYQACISIGDAAPIIIQGNSSKIVYVKFGMAPSRSRKKLDVINVRVEGKYNVQNEGNINTSKGILSSYYFQNSFYTKRCLVPVSALLVCGGVMLDYDWFLCHFVNKAYRPFALAGIYDRWEDKNTGETHIGFALLTQTGSRLSKKLNQNRVPVILREGQWNKWLRTDTPIRDLTYMLNPDPAIEDAMNAYPVSSKLIKVINPGMELLYPIGEKVFMERKRYEYK